MRPMTAAVADTGTPEEHAGIAGARPPRTPATREPGRRFPRVLHVDTAREWRGGQTQLLHLAASGPPCAVALPPDAPLRPALEARGVPVFPIEARGGWWGAGALADAARRYGADLIAAHTSHAHALALR